jgi:hypothetical protein
MTIRRPLSIEQRVDGNGELGSHQNGEIEGRGDSPPAPRRRPGRPAKAPAVKAKGHKLGIASAVFRRLLLHSIQTGRTMSDIANEILDAHLPNCWIQSQAKSSPPMKE